MLELSNRVKVDTATTGVGSVSLGSAWSDAYCTYAEGGATDGAEVSYLIEQGTNFELGVGIYTAAGPTQARTTVRLSKIGGVIGATQINLDSSPATVSIVANAWDLFYAGGPLIPIEYGGTGSDATATNEDVWAATPGAYVDAGKFASAAAPVVMPDGIPVAVNWEDGLYFTLEIAGDRTLQTPTNGQPGTFRRILVDGNDTTSRALAFDGGYIGTTQTLTGITSAESFYVEIFCLTPSAFTVVVTEALAWVLQASGATAIMDADFASNRYYHNGEFSGGITDFNTEIGGDFVRNSTATYVNSSGLIAIAVNDEIRFDHDPVTLEPIGLLMEGSRTNLCLQSEDFGTIWGNTWGGGVTLTLNDITAPDGTLTADKMERIDNAGDAVQQYNDVIAAASVYTLSVYMKNDDSLSSRFELYDNNTAAAHSYLQFDWTAGVPATSSSSGATSITYQDVGNGWYRISYVSDATAGSITSHRIIISPDRTGSDGFGIWVWGAQIELGAFVSSYIPTTTVAVTRAEEKYIITQTTTPFVGFNNDEGALIVSGISGPGGGTRDYFAQLNANTDAAFISSNRVGTAHRTEVQELGTAQAQATATIADFTAFKSAMSWKVDDFAGVFDGGAAQTDTSGVVAANLQRLVVGGKNNPSAGTCFGHVKRVTIFDFRVSDEDIVLLTE